MVRSGIRFLLSHSSLSLQLLFFLGHSVHTKAAHDFDVEERKVLKVTVCHVLVSLSSPACGAGWPCCGAHAALHEMVPPLGTPSEALGSVVPFFGHPSAPIQIGLV